MKNLKMDQKEMSLLRGIFSSCLIEGGEDGLNVSLELKFFHLSLSLYSLSINLLDIDKCLH